MNVIDLHEEFLKALYARIPKKNLASCIADILLIERDAAYRRLSGKVNFSAREIGILSRKLKISLDLLLEGQDDYMWLPVKLEAPMKVESMNALFDIIDDGIDRVSKLVGEPRETGNIYNSIPMEFFLYSPVLTKFMLFKWGYNFVGTAEFDNYSRWELPERANGLLERIQAVYNFDRSYYIWDEALISTTIKEINDFHKLNVITAEERKEILVAIKDLLSRIEQVMQGRLMPTIATAPLADFYISPVDLGFTTNYFMAGNCHVFEMMTNFSFAIYGENQESFYKMKQWIDSFKNISTHLTGSGRVERRLYFEEQHRLIDAILTT